MGFVHSKLTNYQQIKSRNCFLSRTKRLCCCNHPEGLRWCENDDEKEEGIDVSMIEVYERDTVELNS